MAIDESTPKKGRLKIGVSTKVEKALYVDPNLMAGRGDEPSKVVIDADQPPPPDATMTLTDGDIQSSNETLNDTDENARHYQDVSLKGALLAPKEITNDRASPSRPPPPFEKASSPSSTGSLPRIGGLDLDTMPPLWIAVIAFTLGVLTTLVGVLIAL